MIDIATWGWPQYTFIVLLFIGWAIHASKHGELGPKYNFFVKTVGISLTLFLLTFGGFFN